MAGSCAVSYKTREQNHNFPLYLYAQGEAAAEGDLFGDREDIFTGRERVENFDPEFREWLDARLGASYPSETVLGYIYAVLHAPAYRERYADLLRSGFPRVPFPDNDEEFVRLAELGGVLMEMHLFRSVPELSEGAFVGQGDNRVSAVLYDPQQCRLSINPTQWFDGVSQEIWAYTVGSYPVLEKYLKDRKRRVLSLDEIEAVETIVRILAATAPQAELIDQAFREVFPEAV